MKDRWPLTCGITVPEVGLELHSRPCKHWEPAKTSEIRAHLEAVRDSPGPGVWTKSTLLFQLTRERRAVVVSQGIACIAGVGPSVPVVQILTRGSKAMAPGSTAISPPSTGIVAALTYEA